tara:strand:- start:7256 stop:8371 length:1116 start_codon:yes stop_codon:yes gene_type:complete
VRKFNIIAFPYRDLYFRHKYGPAVRDLQIIDALSHSPRVEKITVVNRPVSIFERISGKPKKYGMSDTDKVTVVDRTSLQMFAHLQKRKWFGYCYDEYNDLDFYEDGLLNVVLDFTPLSLLPYQSIRHDYIWYDMIDNFTKHNRYSTAERELVGRKYELVGQFANLITGVSEASVANYNNGVVLPNSAGASKPRRIADAYGDVKYDFGFIGFITDKFDLRLITSLAARGYNVGIFGAFYDAGVRRKLQSISGVHIGGPFQHSEIPRIVRQFKVGLIPYLKDKLHDESPIKLYQYLLHGRPVLSSVQYEIVASHIGVYENAASEETAALAASLIALSAREPERRKIAESLSEQTFWDYKLDRILDRIADEMQH